ncbi:ATP-binding protein [Flavobacterium salilacus subsp. salilacus]|uniref:NACHT domain-containing protein n=1 Tax=Flavobacterium TaxID=237 RepID=UPI001074FF68|nr:MULTISPECIES: ATP-binding protein [Flavobacterium]KAF2518882.1 ATP-binding protein [Flavobacterium salilacus subsp. salilacus]MBE1614958.1 ATP-binding protein [Flavobacterium sp. SaA2.13]
MEIRLNSSKLKFKLNEKTLLKNLFDLNIGTLIADTIDISSSKEAKAYYLLYNANHKTNVQLTKELGQDKIDQNKNLMEIFHEIESEWKTFFEQEIILKKDFFDNILQYNTSYLTNSFRLFQRYAELIGITVPEDFSYKYYLTYRDNLVNEYQENKEKYKEIVDFFDNPIYEENKKLITLLESYKNTKNYYITPLQSGVKESLKDLYIEPYFQVYKNNLLVNNNSNYDFERLQDELTIHDFVNNYFLDGVQHKELRNKSNMLFLLGQPGQGKTSFCYRVIYDILEKNHNLPETPIYFLKIRDLHARDFIDDTFNTINRHLYKEVDFNIDKCLLVLDGLDEAYMSGGLTDHDLKILYERLKITSKNNRNLKIILTSRLNYLNTNDPSIEGSLVVRLGVLNEEQIKLYIDNFSSFYPKNKLKNIANNILTDENFKDIKELLEQPVLMYFIAIADIDIQENDSKAVIYDKIFESLAKRSWDKSGQLSYIKCSFKIYNKYLRSFIRNVAFEIYQSPNLHISIKKLSELEATKLFVKKCFDEEIYQEDKLKEISKYLLISFYFQQTNKNEEEDTAIEFFHNSLWEFLTAEYLWLENKRVVINQDEDGEYKPLRVDEYYNAISYLVGNKKLKWEVMQNLENIISLENQETKDLISNLMKDVFYKIAKKDMLLDYDSKNETLSPRDKMHNIFELMWMFYYITSYQTGKRIETNLNINLFLFDNKQPSFSTSNKLINLDLKDDAQYSCFISDALIQNTVFDIDFTEFNFYDNYFFNTLLHQTYFSLYVNDNKFEKVTFEDTRIYVGDFSGNEFILCKFNNIQIPKRETFKKILKNNKFDDYFIENHKVVQRTAKSFKNQSIKEYYIVCTDSENIGGANIE